MKRIVKRWLADYPLTRWQILTIVVITIVASVLPDEPRSPILTFLEGAILGVAVAVVPELWRRRREKRRPACCVCGSKDVVYWNYQEQPFCCPCAACCPT